MSKTYFDAHPAEPVRDQSDWVKVTGDATALKIVEQASDGVALGQPGAKLDAGKAPVVTGFMHYFPHAMKAVALVSQAGINKGYAPGSWKTVANGYERYGDALARHLAAEADGFYDQEVGGTNMLHAAQVAWNAMARLELLLNKGIPVSPPDRKDSK